MVTRSKAKIGVFLIQLLTLHIFTCHLYFQIWFSREYFVKNLSDSSVHIFYALCWIGFTAYKRNFWEKGKSVCWLYNEVSKINGRYRSKIHMNWRWRNFGKYLGRISWRRQRTTAVEKVIISWLPSQFNCVAGTMFLFMHGPKKPQFIYCYIPSEWKSLGAYGFCFLAELINIVAGASSAITEFYFHAFCIRSFVFWNTDM